jgi:CBS domain-containing protein
MTKSIAQILKQKGRTVYSTTPETKIFDALKVMADNGVGALVVLDEKEHVVGIFSERDHVRKVDLDGRCSHRAFIHQVMSEDVCYVTPEISVDEAMAIMTENRCRHLPVMEKGRLVGLVSIGDLVKASLEEKDFVIKQLKKYIKGDH